MIRDVFRLMLLLLILFRKLYISILISLRINNWKCQFDGCYDHQLFRILYKILSRFQYAHCRYNTLKRKKNTSLYCKMSLLYIMHCILNLFSWESFYISLDSPFNLYINNRSLFNWQKLLRTSTKETKNQFIHFTQKRGKFSKKKKNWHRYDSSEKARK